MSWWLSPGRLSAGTILKFNWALIAAAGASISNWSGGWAGPTWQALAEPPASAVARAWECNWAAREHFSDMMDARTLSTPVATSAEEKKGVLLIIMAGLAGTRGH